MNNINSSQAVGQRIKSLREKDNLSQQDLAKEIDMNRSVLNRIEFGTRPARDTELVNISNFFNVTVDYLLGTTTSKKGKTPDNATESDLKDLKDFMEHNDGSMTYGGEELTETEKEQLKFAMETVFWKRQKAKKATKGNDDEE